MNIEQLIITAKKAEKIFQNIENEYPFLSGYLVFSSRYGQCNITSDITDILKNFPEMIESSLNRDRIREKLTSKQSINEFSVLLNSLEIKDNTFVEIRFYQPDLHLISELQRDNIISKIHTPQTKASIRIVLGTIEEILKRNVVSRNK